MCLYTPFTFHAADTNVNVCCIWLITWRVALATESSLGVCVCVCVCVEANLTKLCSVRLCDWRLYKKVTKHRLDNLYVKQLIKAEKVIVWRSPSSKNVFKSISLFVFCRIKPPWDPLRRDVPSLDAALGSYLYLQDLFDCHSVVIVVAFSKFISLWYFSSRWTF